MTFGHPFASQFCSFLSTNSVMRHRELKRWVRCDPSFPFPTQRRLPFVTPLQIHPANVLGRRFSAKKIKKKKCFCLMYISISVILNFKRLNCGEKRWGKDKASYIFKTFTVYRRERFPVSVKGGINFSWQRHAVVILCEETCCYFDLAITAPKWPLSMLLLSAFR